MSDANISWEGPALKLLDRRDRFTRHAILEDFNRDYRHGAIKLESDSYLTPVSDQRFSVIWKEYDSGQRVSVRAVVPLTNVDFGATEITDEARKALSAYVKRVVKSESKGEIDL